MPLMLMTHAATFCTHRCFLVMTISKSLTSHDFGEVKDSSFTWPVGFPAGAKVELYVEDADNQEAWSGAVRVIHSDSAFRLTFRRFAFRQAITNHVCRNLFLNILTFRTLQQRLLERMYLTRSIPLF